jgi:hypothetical protein
MQDEVQSLFNTPLSIEARQRVYCAALDAAEHGLYPQALPKDLPLSEFRHLRRQYGPSINIVRPEYVERVFGGVTLALYRRIEELYCSRVGRSIRTVAMIVQKESGMTTTSPVTYEAVWAICLYLERRRVSAVEVSIAPERAKWDLFHISPDVKIRDQDGSTFRPAVVCVEEPALNRILGFRVANPAKSGDASPLATYDALASLRQPGLGAAAGLVWSLPEQITVDGVINLELRKACGRLGIPVSAESRDSALQQALNGLWWRDISTMIFAHSEFEILFDTHLAKIHGFGPRRTQQEQMRKYRDLNGYNQDPASQFPALRYFLPPHREAVAAGGEVEYDGLHYEDDLLKNCVGQEVALRQSEESEAVAWVYLEEEILCRAVARELRRDGGYRSKRVGR